MIEHNTFFGNIKNIISKFIEYFCFKKFSYSIGYCNKINWVGKN